MQKNLKKLKDSTWAEVFSTWKDHEGNDPVWQKFAKQEKGWESWTAWRSYHASFLDLKSRNWALYEIQNPNTTIPNFIIGPFKGWQAHFTDELKHTKTFADLVNEQPDWVTNNTGIKSRMNNFPQGTQFIGIHFADSDETIIFEGHHRSAAVALAQSEGNPIQFKTNPTIAITKFATQERALLKDMLNKDSAKPNRDA